MTFDANANVRGNMHILVFVVISRANVTSGLLNEQTHIQRQETILLSQNYQHKN